MDRRTRTGAAAIAHARDLLAPEDEQLSARLDDVERGTSVAHVEAVLGLVTGALASSTRLRPLQYRKLAAVQAAARARRAELADPTSPAAPETVAPRAVHPIPVVAARTHRDERRPKPWLAWLARLRPGAGQDQATPGR
jgi:hypothetical protein